MRESGRVMRRIAFRPVAQEGQSVPFTAVSAASAALTVGKAHWLWSDYDCWIRVAAGGAATATHFPLPARAVAEYTPTRIGVDDQVSVIRLGTDDGTLYIGRSED